MESEQSMERYTEMETQLDDNHAQYASLTNEKLEHVKKATEAMYEYATTMSHAIQMLAPLSVATSAEWEVWVKWSKTILEVTA